MAPGEVFPNPKGKEYALTWGDPSKPGQSGMIRMTDLLFNYYFYSTAFGLDGAYRETQVAGTSYTYTRRIGGPSKNATRPAYTRKVVPTWRGGAYDSGTQLYAIDGDDAWNFEISGSLSEFRLWLQKQGKLTNLKRTLVFRTATGVVSSAVASSLPTP